MLGLNSLAKADLDALWNLLRDNDPLEVKKILEEVFPQLAQDYGRMAALNANDFYAQMRQEAGASGLYKPSSAMPSETEALKASARWGIGPLFQADSNFESALTLLGGSLQRHVANASRRTIDQNVRKDPSKPRFARVPQGPTTCPWCLILASRGATYADKKSAGDIGAHHNDYHDHCNCEALPVFGDRDFDILKKTHGYDPDALYDQYREIHGNRMDLQETAQAWGSKFGV
jgi:hypothetical protein